MPELPDADDHHAHQRRRMFDAWLAAELDIEAAIDRYQLRACSQIDSGGDFAEPTLEETASLAALLSRERLLRHASRRRPL